ncbi:MAG: hypothetical protein ACE5GE_05915, partial [Phycisphaerae bacterium]
MKKGLCKSILRVALIAALTWGTWAGRSAADAPEQEDKPMSAATFEGLKLRPLGPALMSGRVGDFAVDP